jgi:hypothetical protein
MVINRGIVLNFDEIHDSWIPLLKKSQLNVLGLHNWSADGLFENKIDEMISFMNSERGHALLESLDKANIRIEFEIHAMSWLLPRQHYASHPDWFRMDDRGNRTPDANCCPTHAEGIEIIQENSIELAKQLRPTTHRYFFWQDDNKPWCNCRECRDLTASDQNLMLMNKILEAVRSVDKDAKLAFLAYMNTLDIVPQTVQPSDGIFLEITGPFIHHMANRELQRPMNNAKFQQSVSNHLSFFGAKGAHVLEYWLDASLQSGWRKPAKRLHFGQKQVKEDIAFYVSQGFQSITSFGVFLDADYFREYGIPPVEEYGRVLQQ